MSLIRGGMSSFLTLLALTGCAVVGVQPGQWHQINATTLEFRGAIETGSDQAFLKLVTPEIKRIRVNTFGGNVETALVIAEYLHAHQIDLEVDGVCVSSCANYWFPAAKRKIVPKGAYVGLHGDVTSSIPYWKQPSPEAVAYAKTISAKEQAFYQKVGLNPDLFPYSIEFLEVNNVGLWAVSPSELACAGINHLEMWFPSDPASFTMANRWPYPTVGISAQDRRQQSFCDALQKTTGPVR